jgi:hypothetical protein
MRDNQLLYIKGFNAGRASMKSDTFKLERQIRELKRLVDCKHMRVGSYKTPLGYSCKCLTCGHEWAKKDKPLSEFEAFMKAGMERENSKKGVRNE